MRKTIIKSLVVFSVFAQVAIAQNAGTIDRFNNDIFGADSTKLESYVGQFGGSTPSKSSQATSVSRPMNQDSTNLIPNNIVIPITNTYTAPTVVIPPQNGSCGASNGSIVTSAPTSFLCNIGIPTGVTNNGGSYSWSCSGNNYGNPSNVASCSAQQRVVGQCGSDNGKTMSSTPTNLCASGTPSSVSSNGTSYSWSCNGNYGAPASCSASQLIDPYSVCGMPYSYATLQRGNNTTYYNTDEYREVAVKNMWGIGLTSYQVCPGGYVLRGELIPGVYGGRTYLELHPELVTYTSDGVYSIYNPTVINGFKNDYLTVSVIGLDALKTKHPNLKFGCPPNYLLTAMGCWKNY